MTVEYHPIEAYGLIGNGETCALVGPDGSIDWYPVPHVESPSAFARVLDAERGGSFRVGPDRSTTSLQSYLDGTNVLETTFESDEATVRLVDFLPHVDMTGVETDRTLYRKVECTNGECSLSFAFDPQPNYAMDDPGLALRNGQAHASGSDPELVLAGEVPFELDDTNSVIHGSTSLRRGQSVWLTLSHDGGPPDIDDCDRTLAATVEYWREWTHDHVDTDSDGSDEERSEPSCVFDGPWHDEVVRSELVLKLLAHEETGAVTAAPTTSLPEEFGGVRNWDYRFNWPRDAAFTVQALAHLGHLDEAGAYFEWVLNRCASDPGEIQPLYGLHGEIELTERELTHFHGYRGSAPVRVGNAAAKQRQLDLYGELLLAIAATVHHGWDLPRGEWPAVRRIVEYVRTVWDRPDSGIWEVRSEPRHFVHSKVMCWAALDRGIEFAEANEWEAPVEQWRETREEIRRAILERGYDDRRETFVQSFDSDAVDAAALLFPIVGFLPFDDERIEGTVATIRDRLETRDGLVHRYDGEDGLPGDEGTFTLCSFWLVDVLALSGEVETASALFETLIGYASSHGLFAEEIDPTEPGDVGTHRGNYPQGFSHIGVINSALYLGRVRSPETPGPDPIGIWLGEGSHVPD